MLTSAAALGLLLSAVAPATQAARIDFTGVRTSQVGTHFPNLAAKFGRKTLAARDSSQFGVLDLNDSKDLSYLIDLQLGGQKFTVSIDTGSSDLWVEGSVSQADLTGSSGNITYAKGAASGPIKTADLQFAGYTVKDQAFLEADDNTSGSPGIIGLGPQTGSVIYQTFLGDKDAEPPLSRIFRGNTSFADSSETFITSILGRAADDPSHPFPGQLTVSEILPGYEAVTQQPKLLVTGTDFAENQHWQALLDANGFLVNGKAITLPQTAVASTKNSAQLTAVFDNGFSLPQLPKSMVDAIYSGVKGAKFSSGDGLWILPCQSEINVTFKFGGVSYPVHPLDTVISAGEDQSQGCAGAFQPITFDSGAQLDMILGMAFLRNTYMLNSFGALLDGQSAAPYTQLLSLTNDTERAHNEFVNARPNTKSSATRVGAASFAAGLAAFGAAVLLR